MIYVIYLIIIGGLIVSDIQNGNDILYAFIEEQKKKAKKNKATRFYNSTEWHRAKRECKRLQMERTGLDFLMCEQCGTTNRDFDEYGKPIRFSVGHDKARSLSPELALDQDNLFVQCMPCNLAQGVEDRLLTGYHTV